MKYLKAAWLYLSPQAHVAVIFFLIGFAAAEIIRVL